MKRIPIKAAKDFGLKYGKDQVIIICFDNKSGKTWVTTWGKSLQDCEYAAIGGNRFKRFMKWPEELCHETPARLKKLGKKL